jgi:AraC-like DNA-binding protein
MTVHRRFARVPFRDTALNVALEEAIAVRESWSEPCHDRPKVLQWLLIALNEQGESIHDEGQRRVVAPQGSLIVQPRGLLCTEETPGTWQTRYLLLDGALVDAFESEYWAGRAERTEVYEEPAADLVGVVSATIESMFAQPAGHPWKIMENVAGVLHALLECPPLDPPDVGLLSRARRLIESDVANPWRVEDLASALGLHPRALARWFADRVGQSPGAWVRERRMQMALGMLRQGMSVQAAAEFLGFTDTAAFSRQFRSVVGEPPSALRSRPPTRYAG